MSQHVLLERGKVIPFQTIQSLTQAEVDSPLEKVKRDAFDKAIQDLYGDHKAPPPDWIRQRKKSNDGLQYLDVEDGYDSSFGSEEELGQKTLSMPEVDSYDDFDVYVGAEVLLSKNGKVMQATKVLGWSTDIEGNPIGTYDLNPMINTRVYVVMFPDGAIQQYSAKLIAESL